MNIITSILKSNQKQEEMMLKHKIMEKYDEALHYYKMSNSPACYNRLTRAVNDGLKMIWSGVANYEVLNKNIKIRVWLWLESTQTCC